MFRPADDITEPGVIPVAEAIDRVFTDWDRQVKAETISNDVVIGYKAKLRTFARSCQRHDIRLLKDITRDDVLAWIRSAPERGDGQFPARNTMYARRSALRGFFGTCLLLGLWDVDPAATIDLAKRSGRTFSPLTDKHIAYLKDHCREHPDEPVAPVVIALLLCGVTIGDVGWVVIRDIDPRERRIWIESGSYRTTSRWIQVVDDWAWDVIRIRARVVFRQTYSRDTPIAYTGTSQDRDRRSSAASTVVMRILSHAPFYRKGTTRPASITGWVAMYTWRNTKSIERVAAAIGSSSLDAVSDLVGYDWKDLFYDENPPRHRRKPTP